MTPKKILIFVALLIVFVVWESFSALFSNYPITNFPPATSTVLALGDSLTVGVGASDTAHGFVSLLAKRLAVTIENRGAIEATSKDILLTAERDIAASQASTTMIFIGLNDMGQHIPKAETLANIRVLIVLAQKYRMTVVLIGFQQAPDDAYALGLAQLAKETGSIYTPDVLGDIASNPTLMADVQHPNDKGYLKMTDKLAPNLEGVVLAAPAQKNTPTQ